MSFRDHEAITIEKLMGLYDRGNAEEVPIDHFTDVNNLEFIGDTDCATRDGLNSFIPFDTGLGGGILRVKTWEQFQIGTTYIVLIEGGKLYYVTSLGVKTLILTIPTMTDFAMVSWGNRIYISPFLTTTFGTGLVLQQPVGTETLYVYNGVGVARAAGCTPPGGAITPANGAAGHTDAGLHIFGVVFETDTGALSQPAALASFVTGAALSVSFTTIPVGGATVTKRHIVISKKIVNFNGDLTGYDLFFFATINDNVTVALANQSFYDADLIDDATYLFDNFTLIPAGVALTVYHNRLCIGYPSLLTGLTTVNPTTILVSAPDDPESISQIDGFCLMEQDGNPITNLAPLRDVLYSFKKSKTAAFVDNGDVPSSWPVTKIDDSLGTGVHGISATTQATDYLIIATYAGLFLFNGRFIFPELSYKVSATWLTQDFQQLNQNIQVTADFRNLKIYVVMTSGGILYGDFSNGLDPKKIKWAKWTFKSGTNNSLSCTDVLLTDITYSLSNVIKIAIKKDVTTNSWGIYTLQDTQHNDLIYNYAAGTHTVDTVAIPIPYLKTAYIGNVSKDTPEGIFHVNAIRLRISGVCNPLFIIWENLLGSQISTPNLVLTTPATVTTVEPTILCNLVAQRVRLLLELTALNDYFTIKRIIIFVKPITTEYPL